MAKKATEEATTINDVIKAVNTLAEGMQTQQQQINGLIEAYNSNGNNGSKETEDLSIEGEGVEGEDDKDFPYEPGGEGRAKQDLVKHAFDTPENRRSEMTETPRMLVTPTAFIEAKNEFFENIRKDRDAGGKGRSKERFSTILIRKRDKRMVSVGRKGRMEAMAFSQIQQEKEATPDTEFGL